MLYWRPIVPGWNDQPDTMARVLHVGQATDAIVFTGYYRKAQNAEYLRGLGVEVPYGDDAYHRREVMPAGLDARVIAAWRDSGITTPLFRKTSCGVSFAHQVADYNGRGVRELCDICPQIQRTLCADQHRRPSPEEFEAVLGDLGYTSDHLIEDGHVWTHGLGEQRRYAIQHTLGYQIWELDQPHLLHAHGRSLTGYQPSADEHSNLAAVREAFTHTTRLDGDD